MTLTEDQPRHAKQLKRAMILTRGQISNRQRERYVLPAVRRADITDKRGSCILTWKNPSLTRRPRPTAIMGAGLGKDVAFHVVGDVDASGSNTPWDELVRS
ncbi:hypothetical protein CLAIMM_12080 [Cladophialophora immunda]|nr:hypothetical protein CLAIMM_12080 [Cladophialophora immunda]